MLSSPRAATSVAGPVATPMKGGTAPSGSSLGTEELRWTEAGCLSRELFMQESLYTDLLVDAEEFAISTRCSTSLRSTPPHIDPRRAATAGLGSGEGWRAWLVRDMVRRLRRKLGDDADNPKHIITEPRVGYRISVGKGSGEGTM